MYSAAVGGFTCTLPQFVDLHVDLHVLCRSWWIYTYSAAVGRFTRTLPQLVDLHVLCRSWWIYTGMSHVATWGIPCCDNRDVQNTAALYILTGELPVVKTIDKLWQSLTYCSFCHNSSLNTKLQSLAQLLFPH